MTMRNFWTLLTYLNVSTCGVHLVAAWYFQDADYFLTAMTYGIVAVVCAWLAGKL